MQRTSHASALPVTAIPSPHGSRPVTSVKTKPHAGSPQLLLAQGHVSRLLPRVARISTQTHWDSPSSTRRRSQQ